ncbi:MAG: TlpA family protein disulfide reductase [Saprospiraceae bacterium]|nr:TlpA family protein disulfide reductase [Saprospiraceae bacterium]
MKEYRKYLVLIWVFYALPSNLTYAQAPEIPIDTVYFSEIHDTLNFVYKNPSNFFGSKDINEGFLNFYDEIRGLITGTYIDDLVLHDIDDNQYQLSSFDKPIFFHVTASWCAPCQSEKPALKDLVEKYHNQVVFISVFWDGQEGVAKMRNDYHDEMILIPSRIKHKGPNEAMIPGFRHILGFPFTFFAQKDRKIIKVSLGGSSVGSFPGKDGKMITYTEEDVYKKVTESFEKSISLLLEQ